MIVFCQSFFSSSLFFILYRRRCRRLCRFGCFFERVAQATTIFFSLVVFLCCFSLSFSPLVFQLLSWSGWCRKKWLKDQIAVHKFWILNLFEVTHTHTCLYIDNSNKKNSMNSEHVFMLWHRAGASEEREGERDHHHHVESISYGWLTLDRSTNKKKRKLTRESKKTANEEIIFFSLDTLKHTHPHTMINGQLFGILILKC